MNVIIVSIYIYAWAMLLPGTRVPGTMMMMLETLLENFDKKMKESILVLFVVY